MKTFEQQVKKKEKLINFKKRQLENLIAKDSSEDEKYLIKIGKGKQTKLFNVLTKKELKYREELMPVKNSFDHLLKGAPERTKKYGCSF